MSVDCEEPMLTTVARSYLNLKQGPHICKPSDFTSELSRYFYL